MIEATFTVLHPGGLHARPSARLYRSIARYRATTSIQNLSRPDTPPLPLSTINLLQLGLCEGDLLHVRVDGEDEGDVMRHIATILLDADS